MNERKYEFYVYTNTTILVNGIKSHSCVYKRLGIQREWKTSFNMIIYTTISDFHGVKRFGDFFLLFTTLQWKFRFHFFSFRK